MSSIDCIFCKIITGLIPSPRIFEDDQFICIRDIQPQAKIHLLLIPKHHVASLDEAFPTQGVSYSTMLARMMELSVQIARENHLLPPGYRSVINTGKGGGQTVFHLHLHLLSGDV